MHALAWGPRRPRRLEQGRSEGACYGIAPDRTKPGWPLEDKPTPTAPQHLVCRVVQSLHTNHRISIIEASIC